MKVRQLVNAIRRKARRSLIEREVRGMSGYTQVTDEFREALACEGTVIFKPRRGNPHVGDVIVKKGGALVCRVMKLRDDWDLETDYASVGEPHRARLEFDKNYILHAKVVVSKS